MQSETNTMQDDVFTFDAPAEHLDTTGAQYPAFQWFNGDPKLAGQKGLANNPIAVGGFFGKVTNFPEELPEPWFTEEVAFSSGDSETGYMSTEITVAIILMRKDWRVMDGGKTLASSSVYFVYDGKRAKSRVQLLCASPSVVKKDGTMYPFTLSFNGMCSTGIDDPNEGILNNLDKNVIGSFRRLVGKEYPRYCFWVRLTGKRDANGKAIFDMVGQEGAQSPIVKPDAPGIHKPLDMNGLKECYVGTEKAKLFASWRSEAEAAQWARVRSSLETLGDGSSGNGETKRFTSGNGDIKTITDKQVDYVYRLAEQKNINADEYAAEHYACSVPALDRIRASEMIEILKNMPVQKQQVLITSGAKRNLPPPADDPDAF